MSRKVGTFDKISKQNAFVSPSYLNVTEYSTKTKFKVQPDKTIIFNKYMLILNFMSAMNVTTMYNFSDPS